MVKARNSLKCNIRLIATSLVSAYGDISAPAPLFRQPQTQETPPSGGWCRAVHSIMLVLCRLLIFHQQQQALCPAIDPSAPLSPPPKEGRTLATLAN